jgi:hypothetical protein
MIISMFSTTGDKGAGGRSERSKAFLGKGFRNGALLGPKSFQLYPSYLLVKAIKGIAIQLQGFKIDWP